MASSGFGFGDGVRGRFVARRGQGDAAGDAADPPRFWQAGPDGGAAPAEPASAEPAVEEGPGGANGRWLETQLEALAPGMRPGERPGPGQFARTMSQADAAGAYRRRVGGGALARADASPVAGAAGTGGEREAADPTVASQVGAGPTVERQADDVNGRGGALEPTIRPMPSA